MRLLKIGRDASCDIVLHSNLVSSLHAELTLMNSGDIMLEDKGSRNGTFVMNQPVKPGKPVSVRRGDAIRFADVELQWSQVPLPEDNSAYRAIYSVGSNFNNDIQVSGGTVSRYHATIKVGRDGKVYIVDHSKNGTTVDGQKIPSNTPIRIKKSSAVVCGGVPLNLKTSIVQWPSQAWKTVLAAAAGLLLLVGIGIGAWKVFSNVGGNYEDGQLYERFKSSSVYIKTVYHFEVSVGDLSDEDMKSLGIPKKVLPIGDSFEDVSNMSQSELLDALNRAYEKAGVKNQGLGSGTGFFVSNSGEIITNLHVVKFWLFTNAAEDLENRISRALAEKIATLDGLRIANNMNATYLSAYTSKVKVKGVVDYIAVVPNGELFDNDNVIKCRILYADENKENLEKDVALIQTITKRLPTQECTYVNVKDSMDLSDEAFKAGQHVYVLGFPEGVHPFLQSDAERTGIHCYGTGGNVTAEASEFSFSFDAAAKHGSSGSAIYNKKGMLIGVLNSGDGDIFNKGVKAKYIKEILDKPHKF